MTLAQLFPVSFLQFFKKPYLQNTGWLTAPADSSVPTNVLSIDHILFIFSFIFSFVIDNCSYGSLLRKSLKMKDFLLLAIHFYFLHKCFWGNFASTIICPCTLKKMQISMGKSLGNCWMLRWISKAAFKIEKPSFMNYNQLIKTFWINLIIK